MSYGKEDGEQQTCAGTVLLEQSGLVFWCVECHVFVSQPNAYFEDYCQRIHPKFGRMICWMNFSAGAEFLLKGICLSHSMTIVKEEEETKCVPQYPGDAEDMVEWSREYLGDWKCRGIDERPNYGTLRDTLNNDGKQSPLIRLLDENGNSSKISEDERCLIRASYSLLQKSIRNRDAHAFHEGKRKRHQHLVPHLFVPAFNKLADLLPLGRQQLSVWQRKYCDSLS